MTKKLRAMLRAWCTPNLTARDRWVAEVASRVPSGSRVLDAGAGSAPYRDLFAHCEYFTQDAAALDPAKLRDKAFTKLDFVCDASSIPVADGYFDVVLCTEVIEHVPEPIRVLAEFSRILRKGGRLYLSAPLGSGLHQEPYHFYGGYTPYFYRFFAARHGFSVEDIASNGGSTDHLRQWCLWAAQILLETDGRRGIVKQVLALMQVPFWLLGAVMAWVLGVMVDDKRFCVGYHVSLVRE